MSDPRNILKSLFDPAHRFPNFGNLLRQVHVEGFRGHLNTNIAFESPITAFCGLNGSGKSTILQLCATAYRAPSANAWHYYIKDFMVVGTLDPNPFTHDATVEFSFCMPDQKEQSLTLSRNSTARRWRGYPRRPTRQVLFAGVGLYLPRIEQRDFVIRNAAQLQISSTSSLAPEVRTAICKALGVSYDDIRSHNVTVASSAAKVVSVSRSGVEYSEAHMGYGEGRTQFLIAALESLPEKSLVLIEEPETSLHPSAQYQFGLYLMDVCIRRRHQILLTTHSEPILGSLPSESRIFLTRRTAGGVHPINGLTALEAYSLMTDGAVKALHVLVEDDCAQAALREIVRRIDPGFLGTIGVYAAGSAEMIGSTIRGLRETGLPVVAVRDGDKPAAPTDNIFKLPGSKPPEREILENEAVADFIKTTYGLSLSDFLVGVVGIDHHDWLRRLADRVGQAEPALLAEVARAYARGVPEPEAAALVNLLRSALSR